MKRTILSSIAITLLATAGTMSLANAQGWDDHRDQRGYYQDRGFAPDERQASIDQRLERQRERIEVGIQSGAINRHEAWSLRAENRAIRNKEHMYLADGRLNRAEWSDLQRALDQAGLNIRHAIRDHDWRG